MTYDFALITPKGINNKTNIVGIFFMIYDTKGSLN